MEGILLMLLYLVIGFFKNRSDKIKRKKIESDPNWDSEKKSTPNFNLDNLVNDFLETNFEKTNNNSDKNVDLSTDSNNQINYKNINHLKKESIQKEKKLDKSDKIRKKDLKNKILNKINLNNRDSLKKAIVLKEILDKPLGLR